MPVNTRKLKPLTPKQKAIVEYISTYHSSHGFSPSLEEIAKKFDLNAVSTVHQHVSLIRKKGYLSKEDSQPRGIAPMKQTEQYVEIPLLGKIAAGNPIVPYENPEPIAVPNFMVKDGVNYYALEVKGNSMIEDDVLDEDIILIKHQNTANVGDMIVAVVNDEVTLKRYGGIENGKIKLIPKNSTMRIFYIDPQSDTFEVRGKFAGLIRRG